MADLDEIERGIFSLKWRIKEAKAELSKHNYNLMLLEDELNIKESIRANMIYESRQKTDTR